MELEQAIESYGKTFPRRVAIGTLIVIGIAGSVGLVAYAIHALLVVFIGILVGVFIDGLTRIVMKLRIRRGLALTLVMMFLISCGVASALLVMPRSLDQATSIFDKLPGSVRSLIARFAGATEDEAAAAAEKTDDEVAADEEAQKDAQEKKDGDEAAAGPVSSRRDAPPAQGQDRPAGAPRRDVAGDRARPDEAQPRSRREPRPRPTRRADGHDTTLPGGFSRDKPRGAGGEAMHDVHRADADASAPEADGEGQAEHPLDQIAEDVGPLALPIVRSVSKGLAAIGTFVVIAFMGLYLAAKPEEYFGGFVRLMPPSARDQVREVMLQTAMHLRRWMLGTGISMLSAGVLTFAGLYLLGTPYALALGILAGLAEVIPNVGPVVAAVPAILLSLGGGPEGAGEGPTWWHVVVFYLALQTFQSYVIQPLAQRYMVDVPPALSLAALILMGWLWGGLGLFTAVPIVVIVTVIVKLLYQRDVLGEAPNLASEG